jgi:hypothetical protein
MSGALVSGAITAFSAAGFAKSIVTSIMAQSTRKIIWPATDQAGNQLQGPTQSGDPITESLGGYVAIMEEHRAEVEITKHPVEQGATISDHAFNLPLELIMEIGWTPSSAANSGLPNLLGLLPIPSLAGFTGAGNNNLIKTLFAKLYTIKAQRTLVSVYTGKRVYRNMLIHTLSERTTTDTENALIVTVGFSEILIANVVTLQVPTNTNAQAAPQDTTPTQPQGGQSLQPAPAFSQPTVSA